MQSGNRRAPADPWILKYSLPDGELPHKDLKKPGGQYMQPYAFGIDLGGTTVKIGFFQSDGTLLEKWEIPTRREENGKEILPDIAASIRGFLEEKKLSLAEVEGVGIDVPGAVLAGGIVNRCINLGWGVVPVADELSALLDGITVLAANDANAAALGEMRQAGGGSNVVMITMGTGVGGGVILNGKIVPGAFGGGGEIGHIPMRTDETESCGCGKKGCLEQYASAQGIVRLAEKRLAKTEEETVLRGCEELSAKLIFDAAKEGDAVALSLVEEVCEMMGRAMASISCVVDPEMFIIGGGVSKAGPILIDTIRKYYKTYAFHTSRETPVITASLGNDAGMYGAVQMVISPLL